MDPDVLKTGIASRSGAFPILEPAEMRGAGIVSQRSARPGIEDAVWEYSSETRRLRRLPTTELSDTFGVAADGASGQMSGGAAGATTYASTWDPNSAFGFSARIQDYSYRLLGERSMLASVEAENSPAQPCASDGGRTVCPENWEMRHLYVIEATAKPRSLIGGSVIVPKRILYVDSEGWFITASDQFDNNGQLWKNARGLSMHIATGLCPTPRSRSGRSNACSKPRWLMKTLPAAFRPWFIHRDTKVRTTACL